VGSILLMVPVQEALRGVEEVISPNFSLTFSDTAFRISSTSLDGVTEILVLGVGISVGDS